MNTCKANPESVQYIKDTHCTFERLSDMPSDLQQVWMEQAKQKIKAMGKDVHGCTCMKMWGSAKRVLDEMKDVVGLMEGSITWSDLSLDGEKVVKFICRMTWQVYERETNTYILTKPQ